ncbi:MAG: single-stranded-DNA-specific exonuclease RecJ [Spirochaetales bacterium]|jgi:single-stranded-DNA-specific exonuclease|nr:single-stranded-DNA-specific exonuclease RecJ [Spirochaetales bacterium]
MIWEKLPLDQEKVRALASRYGVDLLTASILARRGVGEPEEMLFYMENDLKFLHNPFLFTDMEDAVNRIVSAREEEERVLVFGDRDVDGIAGISLLVRALEDMGISVSWRLPVGDDPYGLTIEAVEAFAAQDGTLIITVDCGISCCKEIRRARELGIDTIIVDHHNPPAGELPPACAVINPKVENSGYPFRDLAGCGVAAKLVWALRFAETEFYGEDMTLLNVRPVNGAYVLEAALLRNLLPVDSFTETLVPGLVAVDESRLKRFFHGPVFVYGAKIQEAMLREIFGKNTDISLVDLEPEFVKLFPEVRGKSLLRLKENFRLCCFKNGSVSELDVFVDLFTSWVLRRERRLSDAYTSLFDVVAIGTLADMMPLHNENRIIVGAGLSLLNSAKPRDGLRELLRLQNLLGKTISARDISWQLTPVINAAGRMGEPEKAVALLLSANAQEREALARDIVELNERRKKIGDDLWETVLPGARESFERNAGKFVFVCDERIPRGITGIIAQRLVKFFEAPAAACAVMDGRVVGSLRSTRGCAALGFLEACSDILSEFGGHDFAAGFNLLLEALPRFEKKIDELMPHISLEELGEEKVTIDAELPPSYLKPGIEEILAFFAPYGKDNPPLTFLTPGVVLEELDFMGKKEQVHTRLLVRAGEHAWPAVFWNSASRVGTDFQRNDKVNIVYQVEKNFFQNRETPRLSIIDIKRQG